MSARLLRRVARRTGQPLGLSPTSATAKATTRSLEYELRFKP